MKNKKKNNYNKILIKNNKIYKNNFWSHFMSNYHIVHYTSDWKVTWNWNKQYISN
jgi:hypothetical protein